MVITLYAAAALLLVTGLAVDSPFNKTDLILLAVTSFLTGHLVLIQRRLDKIEGITRVSWVSRAASWFKRAASWLWLHREGIKSVGVLAFLLVLLWFDWGPITESVSDDLTAINPKSPHPLLHAVLGTNRLITVIVVWFPIAIFALLMVGALMLCYAMPLATLVGYWPRKDQQKSRAARTKSIGVQVTYWALAAFSFWLLFVMYYAGKEADSFLSLLPSPTTDSQVLAVLIVGLGWMPLAVIAQAVRRRKEKRILTTQSPDT